MSNVTNTDNRSEVRSKIYRAIEAELAYANAKWGHEFDGKNTLNDWITYINMYASDAAKIASSPTITKQKLIKAAGLAISALENFEVNNGFPSRHYEDRVAKD